MLFQRATSLGAVAGLALTGLLVAGSASDARTARARNVFAQLHGTWEGVGSVTTNGQAERMRCRATYTGSDTVLMQSLTCAGSGFRFNVSSQITNQDGKISGQWSEVTRGVTGAVSGSVNGNQIATSISGQGFTAALTVTVGTNTHNVTMQPQGTDISAIQIAFRRAG